MPKLHVFIGLPGSGKSYQLDRLGEMGLVNRDCIIHDYHASDLDGSGEVCSSRHYQSLVDKLDSGENCAVADIKFCEKDSRDKFLKEMRNSVKNIEFIIKYFENKPDICKKNVENDNGRAAHSRIEKINEFTHRYEIPLGAEVIEVREWTRNLN